MSFHASCVLKSLRASSLVFGLWSLVFGLGYLLWVYAFFNEYLSSGFHHLSIREFSTRQLLS